MRHKYGQKFDATRKTIRRTDSYLPFFVVFLLDSNETHFGQNVVDNKSQIPNRFDGNEVQRTSDRFETTTQQRKQELTQQDTTKGGTHYAAMARNYTDKGFFFF